MHAFRGKDIGEEGYWQQRQGSHCQRLDGESSGGAREIDAQPIPAHSDRENGENNPIQDLQDLQDLQSEVRKSNR